MSDIEEFDDVGVSFQPFALDARTGRGAAKLVILGAVAYLATLVVTLPAQTALGWAGAPVALRTSTSGTAWNGAVDLGAGVSARWKFAPLRSLLSISPAATVKVQGPQTSLSGRVRKTRAGVTLERISGEAAWPLIAAAAPHLTFTCDLSMQIDLRRLILSRHGSSASGRAIIPPGVCRSLLDPNAAPTAIPPLMVRAAESSIIVIPQARPSTTLLAVDMPTEGGLKLSLTADGATLLPGAATGPMSLEIRP